MIKFIKTLVADVRWVAHMMKPFTCGDGAETGFGTAPCDMKFWSLSKAIVHYVTQHRPYTQLNFNERGEVNAVSMPARIGN